MAGVRSQLTKFVRKPREPRGAKGRSRNRCVFTSLADERDKDHRCWASFLFHNTTVYDVESSFGKINNVFFLIYMINFKIYIQCVILSLPNIQLY